MTEALPGRERRPLRDEFEFVHEMCSRRLDRVRVNQKEEIDRVEHAVGRDGREQAVCGLVEKRQHHRQKHQRRQAGHVEMHDAKDHRGRPQCPTRMARLFDGRIQNPPEQRLFRDGREQDGEHAKQNLFRHGQGGALQFRHGGLGDGVEVQPLHHHLRNPLQQKHGGQDQDAHRQAGGDGPDPRGRTQAESGAPRYI